MQYRFAYALTGIIEAPNEEHARLQLLMGISLSSHIAALGPDIALRIEPLPESISRNGAEPGQSEHPVKPMEH